MSRFNSTLSSLKHIAANSLIALLVFAGAYMIVSITPSRVIAQEGEDRSHVVVQAEDTQGKGDSEANAESAGAYTFTARRGDSLSLLTRRAIQLYDAGREDIELTPAAAIYAETYIVRELGSRMLEVGEQVAIPRSLIERFANESRNLNEQTLSLWGTYASRADFTLDDISPAAAPEQSDEQTPEQPQNEGQPEGEDSENNESSDEAAIDETDDATWYWWVIAVIVLGVGFYLWSGRPQTNRKK